MKLSVPVSLLVMVFVLFAACSPGPNSRSTPRSVGKPSTVTHSSESDSPMMQRRHRERGHRHRHRRRHRSRRGGQSRPSPGETVPGSAENSSTASQSSDTDGPAETRPAPSDTGPDTISKLVSRGRNLYDRNCSSCHGPNLQGTPPQFPSLVNVKERQTREQILNLLQNGRSTMPSFSHLAPEDRQALTVFLLHRPEG